VIASIEGSVSAVGDTYVIVKIGGIELRVNVPESVIHQAGGTGAPIRLFTHLHVRENEIALYGCSAQEEMELFRVLLGVTGIGPKMALTIISSLSPERLRAAIAQEHVDILTRVPGLGPKTARRIIFQLKDKLTVGAGEPVAPLTEQDAEVIAALTALGYSVVEAQTALQSLPRDPDLSVEERIRLALAHFG
jgi:holliday junction DNA helicase RuvA